MATDRAQAQAFGRRAEWLARWWLRLKFYRILPAQDLARRGSGIGQVDLLARRGSVLAFVEVKARPSLEEAAQAISPRQQDRYIRAAQAFVAHNPHLAHLDIRFDAVLIAPGQWPRHIPNAWGA